LEEKQRKWQNLRKEQQEKSEENKGQEETRNGQKFGRSKWQGLAEAAK
jgi:hypothetical protein